MIQKLKQLAGESAIYGLSSVLTRFVTLLLVPIYTSVLSPSDYGVLNLVNITFFLISTIAVFGLDNSVAIWFWDKTELSERKATFSSWFWFQTLFSIVLAILIILTSSFLSRLILEDGGQNYNLFILAAINLPFLLSHRVLINWYRMQRMAIPTVVFTLAVNLFFILLTIYFIVIVKIGIIGIFYAQLISSFLGAGFVALKMSGWLRIRFFDNQRLTDMLRFGAPLVPSAISFWLLSSSGSYFIQLYVDSTEVGLYQIALSFAGILNIIVMAFNQAWPPFAFSILKEINHRSIFSAVFDLYMIIGSLGVLFLWLFSNDLLVIFTNPEYYGASKTLGLLALNVFIAGITSVTAIGCNIVKTNMPYMMGVLYASILSVILYFLFIPEYGKEGAALGTLIGNTLLAIYVTIKAEKLYPVGYSLGKGLVYLVSLCLCILVFEYLFHEKSWWIKILLMLLYSATVLYLNRGKILSIRNIRRSDQDTDNIV